MELDLRKILEIIQRKLYFVIIGLAGGLLIAALVTSYMITPIYKATATMYVYNIENRTATGLTTNDITVSQKLVNTYIVILKSDSVLNKVADKINIGYTAQQIKQMLSANSISNTEVFEITVSNSNPACAQMIANTIADIAPAEIIRVVKAGDVQVLDYATLPAEPSFPNMRLNLIFGAVLGVVLSISAILIVETLDTSIKDEGDLIDHFTYPIIGIIPNLENPDKSRGYH